VKNKRAIIVGVVALVAMGVIVLSGQRAPPEPVYEGKTLSRWLENYDPANTNSSPQLEEDANNAIQVMGTNAIPALLRMLESHDSKFKLWAVYIATRQHLIEVRFVPDYDRYMRVMQAFDALGWQAQSAVPELIRIYDQSPPATPQANVAALALASIGPPAKAAVPSLVRRATNTNYRVDVRVNAVNALANIHSEPDLTVPVLVQAMQDTNRNVQMFAAEGLGNFGSKAKVAVPALVKFLEANGPPPQSTGGRIIRSNPYGLAGWQALKKIDPEAAAKFVTNTNSPQQKQSP
jgi:hypothetical protein